MVNPDILIFGFDGADFHLLTNMMEKDFLPNIQSIADNGLFCENRSTDIPITPCAWTSFLTGQHPNNHGIYDFVEPCESGLRIVSSENIGNKTLLNKLSENYSVGALNIPMTYPPQLENGFVVSGLLTPPRNALSRCTDDIEVEKILHDEDYQVEIQSTYNGNNEDVLLEKIENIFNSRKRVAKKLIKQKEPDVFIPVFTAGDRICHWFWKYHDESHPEFSPSKYKNEIKKIYKKIDQCLGELIDICGGLDQTTVFLLSDHGFTGLHHGLNMNQALMDSGLLNLKSNFTTQIKLYLYKVGFTIENMYKIARKLRLEHIIKYLADNNEATSVRKALTIPFLSIDDVDFDRSAAYSAMSFGPIFLLQEESREKVHQVLNELEYNNEKIIENIIDNTRNSQDKNNERIPDIVYHTNDMTYLAHRYFEFGSNSVVTDPFNQESGHHSLNGVFLAGGQNISNSCNVDEIDIFDISPTILNFVGMDVPGTMDGKPIELID